MATKKQYVNLTKDINMYIMCNVLLFALHRMVEKYKNSLKYNEKSIELSGNKLALLRMLLSIEEEKKKKRKKEKGEYLDL